MYNLVKFLTDNNVSLTTEYINDQLIATLHKNESHCSFIVEDICFNDLLIFYLQPALKSLENTKIKRQTWMGI